MTSHYIIAKNINNECCTWSYDEVCIMIHLLLYLRMLNNNVEMIDNMLDYIVEMYNSQQTLILN